MIATIIKYLSFFGCCAYTNNKLIQTQSSKNYLTAIKVIILTLLTVIYKYYFGRTYILFPFVLYVLFTCFFSENPKYIVVASVLSYFLNQIVLSLLTIVLSFFLSFRAINSTNVVKIFISILIFFLQSSFIYFFFRIPRYKKGMPFLRSTYAVNIGFTVCCSILLLLIALAASDKNHFIAFIVHFIIIAMFIPLIIWWRHKIKESYLAYLREFELTQLHQQINDLSADNERLSRIVHKDNKLVSAMASSVLTLLEKSPEYDREEFLAQCDSLHKELSELSLHRQELLVSTTSDVSPLGNSHKLVESVLSYEVKNARHSGICTKYNIDSNFMAAIETYLTDEELAHILADLIQNAIIAMKATAQQNLLINLHMINGNPTISVMDSGTEFSPEVLQNLGLAPCSTHLDEGGSGIGLMDIWQLKIKNKASMVIKELPLPGDYTKQLSIIFDGKNKYVVFTNRKQELTKMINRFDMYIESV